MSNPLPLKRRGVAWRGHAVTDSLLFSEARCGDMQSSLLRRDWQSSLVSFEIGWYIFSSVIRPSIYVSSSLALIVFEWLNLTAHLLCLMFRIRIYTCIIVSSFFGFLCPHPPLLAWELAISVRLGRGCNPWWVVLFQSKLQSILSWSH
jgi:hypothetical protein